MPRLKIKVRVLPRKMTAQENERWNFYIHRERQLFGGAHKHLNVKSKLAARAGAALNLDGAASQVTSAWLDEMDGQVPGRFG